MHNLNLATRAGAEVSDQLKYFAERLPATFVYAGIDVEAQGLFAGARGRQIAGRFTVIAPRPFAYGTGEQRDALAGLIATLESLLRLHRHQPGHAWSRLAEYLYRRTGGMIGSLSQLIRGAAILAIEDGTEQITKELLDRVPVDYAAQRADTASRPPRRGSRASRNSRLMGLPGCRSPSPRAQQETVASYLTRLATLHGLPLRELWQPISVPRPGGRRRALLADRLAAVTGHPRRTWSARCPSCGSRHRTGRRCAISPSPAAPLRRTTPRRPGAHLLPHHRYVCTRHRFWIGPPDLLDRPCPSLDDCPRLSQPSAGTCGCSPLGPAAAFDAVLTGFLICAHRWGHPDPTSGEELHEVLWTTRSFILIPKDSELHTFSASKLFACLYPVDDGVIGSRTRRSSAIVGRGC